MNEASVNFYDIFRHFVERKETLKTIFVASADSTGKPNCAPKLLVDVSVPNEVYFIDYSHSRTYAHLVENQQLSLSIMDDRAFSGFRLNGNAQIMVSGAAFEVVKEKWHARVVHYEAGRMIDRLKGVFSSRESEITIPEDFVIVRFLADEAAVVKPGRILRALHKER